MARRSRFRLIREVTNTGTAPLDASATAASFTVNGHPSMELDMAFGNGARESTWSSLAPGASVSDEREVGDLFTAPGDYVIVMLADDTRATLTVHVDP